MPTEISDAQRSLHATSEAIAVFIAVPFLIWLGTRGQLTPANRKLLIAFGLGSLVVDGILLASFSKKPEPR